MADLEALHLTSPIAASLARLGWRADDALVHDAAPTAARGHNLVLLLPPSPVAATPALAGMLSRLGEGRTGLLLAPAGQLDEWGRVVHNVARESGLRVQVAHGTSRATRRLRDAAVDVLITTPETAQALQRRSALHAEALAAVLLAWPESWESDEAVSPLMQDLDKDAQRIVLSSSPERAAAMAERYARRALTLGGAALEGEASGPVRTVGRGVGTTGRRAVGPGRAPRPDLAGHLDRRPERARGDRRGDRAPRARGPRGDRRRALGTGRDRLRPARRRAPAAARDRGRGGAAGPTRDRGVRGAAGHPAPAAPAARRARRRHDGRRRPARRDRPGTRDGPAGPRAAHAGAAVRAPRSGGGRRGALRAVDQPPRAPPRRPRCPTSPRPRGCTSASARRTARR